MTDGWTDRRTDFIISAFFSNSADHTINDKNCLSPGNSSLSVVLSKNTTSFVCILIFMENKMSCSSKSSMTMV